MKFKNKYSVSLIVLMLTVFLSLDSLATTDSTAYYFINLQKDTIFCKELSYGLNSRGYLDRLDYITNDDKEYELRGKKNIPRILTFYIDGITLDKIPYRVGSESKLYVYSERLTVGSLQVYLNHQIMDESVVYRFYIRFEDGEFYRIDKKSDFENIIKPKMLGCDAFKSSLKQEISVDEEAFIELVKIYNTNCVTQISR